MNKKCYEVIDKNRYRETDGFYYEEFSVGDTFEHRPGRTITETDNTWHSLLCMNVHPLHIDARYSANTEFKKNLVSSSLTFSIVSGMSVRSTSAKAIANLGWDKVRLLNPVFVGDTIYAESTILNKRPSKSRPNAGIVTISTKGFKNEGQLIMSFERSFLLPLNQQKNIEN